MDDFQAKLQVLSQRVVPESESPAFNILNNDVPLRFEDEKEVCFTKQIAKI